MPAMGLAVSRFCFYFEYVAEDGDDVKNSFVANN